MKQLHSARDLHARAARVHEEAAQLHRLAAECHDQNRLVAARLSAKSAMDCCNSARLHSVAACDCSDHNPLLPEATQTQANPIQQAQARPWWHATDRAQAAAPLGVAAPDIASANCNPQAPTVALPSIGQ